MTHSYSRLGRVLSGQVAFSILLSFSITSISTLDPGIAFAVQGENGMDRDPGTDGSDGSDEETVIVEVRGTSVRGPEYHYANNGYNGGNGGNGVDGDDPDDSAAGGNGGNGGRGGNVKLGHPDRIFPFSDIEHIAWAGQGGNGGMPGLGTQPDLDGTGGSGGDGGYAYAGLRFADNMLAWAYGGEGGTGYGVGQSGGNGGFAYVEADSQMVDDQVVTISLGQIGGHGGDGMMGADGGNGASVVFGMDDSQFTINTTTSLSRSHLHTFIQGRGGAGGDSENGMAGSAGHALYYMDDWFRSSTNPGRLGTNNLNVSLVGGNGGDGIATGSQPAHGRHGGNAHILVGQPEYSVTQQQNIELGVRGDNGGNALGSLNSGNGGHGGLAVIDPFRIDLSQDVNGNPATAGVGFNINITGGKGGDAEGSGVAGNGASAASFNDISASVGQSSTVDLWVIGGGNRGNGHGGDAVAALENSFSGINSPLDSYVNIDVTARGGHAGSNYDAKNITEGGDAWSSIIQSSTNRVWLNAVSEAGLGNRGRSGDSFAKAYGTGASDIIGLSSNVRAHADFRARTFYDAERLPGIGTNSIADARITHTGVANGRADARARGGWGFDTSGNALAYSYSKQTTTGHAIAHSFSESFGDTGADYDNESLSIAETDSNNSARAKAVAHSTGHRVATQAHSIFRGMYGSAESVAVTSSENWEHSSSLWSRATIEDGTAVQTVDSANYVGFRRANFGLVDQIEPPTLRSLNATISQLNDPTSDHMAKSAFQFPARRRRTALEECLLRSRTTWLLWRCRAVVVDAF